MITVEVNIDWLDKVSNLTVADAIEYLKTLPQSYKLSAYPEGEDLHGVDQFSGLYYEREETEEEVKLERIAVLKRKISREDFVVGYNLRQLNYCKNDTVESQQFSTRLEEAQKKVADLQAELSKLLGE